MATMTVTVDEIASKVVLDITFAPTVTAITVGRRDPSGFTTLIRYGEQVPTPGGHVVMEDYEAPLDVPLVYLATQAAPVGEESVSSAEVVVPSGGHSWLKDPGYPSMNFRISVVTSIAQLSTPARAGVFHVLDRRNPIVVTAKRQGPIGELVMHTMDDMERYAVRDLLARGTVLQLATPPAYGFGTAYIHVGDVDESRVGLAMAPERRWTLPFIVVDRPEGLSVAPAANNTWAAVKASYVNWAELAASGKTWQQLLEEGV